MIHIVDYGLGNIQAFMNLYKRLGIEAVRARSAVELGGARKLILPGVGAFDTAMDLLNSSGMREPVEQLVVQAKMPVLGICVGMQILANGSDEGVAEGLGWIGGRVRSFHNNLASVALPLPHMGWNNIEASAHCPLFNGLESDSRFYFLHSYYFECSNVSNTAAYTNYGFKFDCAVQNENIFGVQFHPEKSHHWGTALLKNFAEL